MKIILLLSVIATLFSCTKEGESGPQGEQGLQGNANVLHEEIKVFASEWVFSASMYGVSKTSSILTQDITNSGSVHLYMELSNGQWVALPYLTTGYYYGLNTIGIFTEGSFVTQTSTFKLVVVNSNLSKPKIDFNDYYQVKEY